MWSILYQWSLSFCHLNLTSSNGAKRKVYGGSDSKESACNAGDTGLIPRLERSPGEMNGNPSSIPAWKIPWTEEPGWLQFSSWGYQELDMTKRQTYAHARHFRSEEVGFEPTDFVDYKVLYCIFLHSHLNSERKKLWKVNSSNLRWRF